MCVQLVPASLELEGFYSLCDTTHFGFVEWKKSFEDVKLIFVIHISCGLDQGQRVSKCFLSQSRIKSSVWFQLCLHLNPKKKAARVRSSQACATPRTLLKRDCWNVCAVNIHYFSHRRRGNLFHCIQSGKDTLRQVELLNPVFKWWFIY